MASEHPHPAARGSDERESRVEGSGIWSSPAESPALLPPVSEWFPTPPPVISPQPPPPPRAIVPRLPPPAKTTAANAPNAASAVSAPSMGSFALHVAEDEDDISVLPAPPPLVPGAATDEDDLSALPSPPPFVSSGAENRSAAAIARTPAQPRARPAAASRPAAAPMTPAGTVYYVDQGGDNWGPKFFFFVVLALVAGATLFYVLDRPRAEEFLRTLEKKITPDAPAAKPAPSKPVPSKPAPAKPATPAPTPPPVTPAPAAPDI